jgi:hypothetical protein
MNIHSMTIAPKEAALFPARKSIDDPLTHPPQYLDAIVGGDPFRGLERKP